MSKVKLSKSGLAQERSQLKLCKSMLPPLDLKRRQLSVELAKARDALAAIEDEIDALETKIGQELPMLANKDIEVAGLVEMTAFELGEENVVGVRLPTLVRIECKVRDYSPLARPAWVDILVDRLQRVAEARTRQKVYARRVKVLRVQERRTTQRVNLFEQILIPTAQRNIRKIQTYLGDAERTAVLRSKLVKAKQAKARQRAIEEGR